MSLNITKTGQDQYRDKIKLFLAGPNNSGKTLFGASAPGSLIGNARGNMMSLASKNQPVVDITSEDDLFQLNAALSDPDKAEQVFGFPVETLVIDTIDEVQRFLINERLKAQKHAEMEPGDWMWLGRKMQTILDAFSALPVHVIYLCHTKIESDGDTGRSFMRPQLQGATVDQIHTFVDHSFMIHSLTVDHKDEETGEMVFEDLHWVRTQQDRYSDWIGSKANVQIPVEVFSDPTESFFDLVFDTILHPGELPTSKSHEVDVIGQVEKPAPKPRTPAKNTRKLLPSELSKGTNIPCETCGKTIETEYDADLSKIQFRQALCNTCYTAKQTIKQQTERQIYYGYIFNVR